MRYDNSQWWTGERWSAKCRFLSLSVVNYYELLRSLLVRSVMTTGRKANVATLTN